MPNPSRTHRWESSESSSGNISDCDVWAPGIKSHRGHWAVVCLLQINATVTRSRGHEHTFNTVLRSTLTLAFYPPWDSKMIISVADSHPKSTDLIWGLVDAWWVSPIITLTGWTLAMTSSWWQNHKHYLEYLYYYYYYYYYYSRRRQSREKSVHQHLSVCVYLQHN